MNPHLNKSVSLIELLIAIALLSVIVIGFSSIDSFSRYHLLTSERRAKLQNEVSYCLEHMSKNISRAIGNERVNGAKSVIKIRSDDKRADVLIYIDANGNGRRDDPAPLGVNPTLGQDHWVGYRYVRTPDSVLTTPNSIWYCGLCRNADCAFSQCLVSNERLVGGRISDFAPSVNRNPDSTLGDNIVNVNITARWQPSQPASGDNPEVTMRNRIKMPGVSTH